MYRYLGYDRFIALIIDPLKNLPPSAEKKLKDALS